MSKIDHVRMIALKASLVLSEYSGSIYRQWRKTRGEALAKELSKLITTSNSYDINVAKQNINKLITL